MVIIHYSLFIIHHSLFIIHDALCMIQTNLPLEDIQKMGDLAVDLSFVGVQSVGWASFGMRFVGVTLFALDVSQKQGMGHKIIIIIIITIQIIIIKCLFGFSIPKSDVGEWMVRFGMRLADLESLPSMCLSLGLKKGKREAPAQATQQSSPMIHTSAGLDLPG